MKAFEEKVKELLVVGNHVTITTGRGGRLIQKTGVITRIYKTGFFDLEQNGRTYFIKSIYNIKPAGQLYW